MGNQKIKDHITRKAGSKVTFTVQLTKETHDKLKRLQVKENRSRTNLISTLISREVE